MDVFLLRKRVLLFPKIDTFFGIVYNHMARQVFAMDDLKRHIFSFGYPEHIAFTKSLKVILKVDTTPFEERFHAYRDGRSLPRYLLEEFDAQELVECIHYFSRCRCCTRHSHDKPYVSTFGIAYTPKIHSSDECECQCRHIGRNCARALNQL